MTNVNQDVDLTNCDKEPIHQLGRIQQYGGLIGLSQSWEIVYCSENIKAFCGIDAQKCLSLKASDIFQPQTIALIRESIVSLEQEQSERLFAEYLFGKDKLFDVSLHISNGTIVIEFEYHQALVQKKSLQHFRTSLKGLSHSQTINDVFTHATDTVASLTGFDRVMLYRFHNDGSGEVVAESRQHHMDSFLGLRYPASDIPKQARKLYVKNLTRQIENVHSTDVSLVSKYTEQQTILDLSQSTLRAVSPIHIEYLKNMGVNASFSLSIVVDGELWGLFACHHNTPHYLSLELRSIIEVYGEVFSLELASRLRNLSLVNTEKAQNLHVKIMATMNSEDTVYKNLAPHLSNFHKLISCKTSLLWVDKKLAKAGEYISDENAASLVSALNHYPANEIVCTDNLKAIIPEESEVLTQFAGMLAIPISRKPRDFLIFLRAEESQSISWAGNPEKPAEYGPNGARLTPRKSFAAWQEIRKGYSAPWLQKEIGLGNLFRQMLLEIVIRNIDERERLIRESQQQQDMLISELNHRVRNILGLISSVISKTAGNADTVDVFKDVLGGRIDAIALAQNQLTQRNWTHAPLKKLLETELLAFANKTNKNIMIEGPDINIGPKAFTTLTLVLHELFTNSVKHGALKHDTGVLNVKWHFNSEGDLALSWQENGYENQPKFKKGFGMVIINRSVPFDLGGQATVEAHAHGINVNLEIPKQHLFHTDNTDNSLNTTVMSAKDSQLANAAQFSSSALILEDNMIIALDVEETLSSLDIKHIYVAANTIEAESFIGSKRIDFAILDVNLGGENSFDIAKMCQVKNIPFVFVTGYSELSSITDNGFENVKLLMKPFKETEITDFVKDVYNH
jgi:light-regulated signal transduction histidine kinase (bacteriophytochrome)